MLSCTVQEFLVVVCRSFILTADVVSKRGVPTSTESQASKQAKAREKPGKGSILIKTSPPNGEATPGEHVRARASRLVDAGSSLGIVPTIVRSTLGILRNMSAM